MLLKAKDLNNISFFIIHEQKFELILLYRIDQIKIIINRVL